MGPDFGLRRLVTGSSGSPRESVAAGVTTPVGLPGGCARCGATIAPGATTCVRCGATITGGNSAEQAERIRLRLQDAIGDAYQLVELLGRGGMGIVFRAREMALDREVALKVLALDPVLSPEAYARFEREAKLAARLDHPNVVPIFAVGQRNTVAYYTMRLVRGGTLEDMLDGHRTLDFHHALEILRDVASALDYAHGQSVVHRDIKPANVLIAESGHAMVSDFGIAKALGAGDMGPGTGAVIGSPGYMSPEQWRGEEIDPPADQYALGVMAFEMLTGRRPFEAVRVQDLLKLHLSAEVPTASTLVNTLPPFVDLALKRAMAKSASGRFSSASAFVEALGGSRPVSSVTRTGVPTAVAPEPAPAGAGLGGTVAFLSLLAGAAVALYLALVLRPPAFAHPAALRHRAAAVHDSTGAAAADSAIDIDTTFDVNTAAPRDARVRPPVAADPVLFAAQGAPPNPGGDASAYIRVVSHGGTARVRVDGRTFGFSPLVIRIEPGPHVISLESSGDAFMPSQVTVDAIANDTSFAIFTANTGLGTPAGAPPPSAPPPSAPPASAPDTTHVGAPPSPSPSPSSSAPSPAHPGTSQAPGGGATTP